MRHKIIVILALCQIVLTLFSWIVSSAMPSLPIKSVLSAEGARWFFGSFVDNMSSPLLVWLVLCAIAYGSFQNSGMKKLFHRKHTHKKISYRQRHAAFMAIALLCIITAIVIMLAFVPHAVLLGVSGNLYPSAFSAAAIPILAFTITFISIIYGIVSGNYDNTNNAVKSLYAGFSAFAPLFPIYILAMQLYKTITFVFL